MDSKSKKDRSGRKHKHKSSEDKKRKRDHNEDSERRRSKKHRKEKSNGVESGISHRQDATVTSSPFHVQASSLYLPLASISQEYPLEGMCAEHLSPLILTYYPPFHGVVLSYSNPSLSEQPFHDDGGQTLLRCIDEYAVSYGWVTAEFLLFKPERDGVLEGYINLQNEGHLGLVCWNLFNASIERQRLPKDWKWIGPEDDDATPNSTGPTDSAAYAEDGLGHYVDGHGDRIEGILKFRVTEIESSHDRERGFLSIYGTMLDEDDENELLERQRATSREGRDGTGRHLGGSRALGATSLGRPLEHGQDDMNGDGRGRRHRAD
ncbi:MAG: hypothetical protein M1818_006436 [Claussenomyces sp. TS43310]|nr:MAG: hypothetical protein M1818_006436 [Claussenomyces sp. TS43310]